MYFIKIVFLASLFFVACQDNTSIQESKIPFIPGREIAQNVDLTFSDSAKVKFRIVTDWMETYKEKSMIIEEYPKGLHIEFFDKNEELTSSIVAKYAKRVGKEGKMTLRDSVVMTNASGDQLTTTGIVWDELNHVLNTTKFIQLVKVASQDTFYGFGFNAVDDFSKFKITRLTGKRRYQNLVQELGIDK